jgi:hypothetical protein
MTSAKFYIALSKRSSEGKAQYIERLSLADRQLLGQEMVDEAVNLYFGDCSVSDFMRIARVLKVEPKAVKVEKKGSWFKKLWNKQGEV